MPEVDYIEYKSTHVDGEVTYNQATQSILAAEPDVVKVEVITNYKNGETSIWETSFLKKDQNPGTEHGGTEESE